MISPKHLFKLFVKAGKAWVDDFAPSKSGVTESFAAAGSLVVLLAWVYYAAQIFLLGAEFTKVYADEHSSLSAAKAMTGTATTAVAGIPPEVPPARPARGRWSTR